MSLSFFDDFRLKFTIAVTGYGYFAFAVIAGAVFCNDTAKALRVIKEVRAGITWINCYNPAFSEAPWGGYKMSGIGRELGTSGLDEYQETKQININISGTPLGWYNH